MDNEVLFTKEQLVESDRYRYQKDVLNAILTDGGFYTLDEVDDKIIEFMEREAE